MSQNDDTGAPAPEATPSGGTPQNNQVPYSRFEEVIRERNEARQQAAMVHQTLDTLVRQQQSQVQRPRQEDPALRALREQNPDLYRLHVKQQKEMEQMRGMAAALVEDNDRANFHRQFGPQAEKYGQQVEEIVQKARANGNYQLSRGEAFIFMQGHERIQQGYATPAPAPMPQVAQAPSVAPTIEAPSTTPRGTSFVNGASAPKGFSSSTPQNREEQLRGLKSKLADVEF